MENQDLLVCKPDSKKRRLGGDTLAFFPRSMKHARVKQLVDSIDSLSAFMKTNKVDTYALMDLPADKRRSAIFRVLEESGDGAFFEYWRGLVPNTKIPTLTVDVLFNNRGKLRYWKDVRVALDDSFVLWTNMDGKTTTFDCWDDFHFAMRDLLEFLVGKFTSHAKND